MQTLVDKYGPIIADSNARAEVQTFLAERGMEDCMAETMRGMQSYEPVKWMPLMEAMDESQLMTLYEESMGQKMRHDHREEKREGVEALNRLLARIASMKDQLEPEEQPKKKTAIDYWRKVRVTFKCGFLAKSFVFETQGTIEKRRIAAKEQAEFELANARYLQVICAANVTACAVWRFQCSHEVGSAWCRRRRRPCCRRQS